MRLLFDLGRNPRISFYELKCVLDREKIQYSVVEYDRKLAVLEVDLDDPTKLTKMVAGVSKIVELLGKKDDYKEIDIYEGKSNKFNYSISSYDTDVGQFRNYLKQKWKKMGLKANYVRLDHNAGPSEIIHKRLLDVVLYNDYIGRTVAVPNMSEFKVHDVSRPKKVHLYTTSIRLARMMINISMVKKGGTLLDPFCGYGTIVQEASFMGINAMGCDIDKDKVIAARENLNHFGLRAKLWVGRAEEVDKVVDEVDVVVTEPYLGPFIKEISFSKAMKLASELEKSYNSFLSAIHKVVKQRVVVIFPYFNTKRGKVELDIDSLIKRVGFKKEAEFKYKERYHNIGRKLYVLVP